MGAITKHCYLLLGPLSWWIDSKAFVKFALWMGINALVQFPLIVHLAENELKKSYQEEKS